MDSKPFHSLFLVCLCIHNHVMEQLNGLDNITQLQPNEIYRIDISFHIV